MSIQQLMYQYQHPPKKKTHKKLIKEKKLYGIMRETVLSSFHMLKLVFRNTIKRLSDHRPINQLPRPSFQSASTLLSFDS